tara:strand:- start:90 stop:1172 length:1083 start_codon:yes stop_codon:yes gene_type:complete
MVTAQLGVASSSLNSVANRVLIDYKDAIQDYRVTDMPVIQMFAENFTTDTGGDVDITFGLPSMKLEQIEEGATPAYQHTDLRNERISVKEWGIAVGVTRRMLEDSRFSEMEMALNEARRAVARHVTEHFVKTVFGIGDSNFGTGVSNASITVAGSGTSAEADLTVFTTNPHGSFFGASPSTPASGAKSRLVEYGIYSTANLNTLGGHYVTATDRGDSSGDIGLANLTAAIELIGSKGLNADTILISPSHYKSLLDLADFTTPFNTGLTGSHKGGLDYVNEVSKNAVVGQLYGMNVVVNSYVPMDRFGVFDMSIKPVAYVERRGLTVEEANPGFGITGSYMSMRYGLKVIRPEAGVIFIGA